MGCLVVRRMDTRLETPVAFLIFNRPDTTRRVFAEIAKARPRTLLVVADGPRADRPGEREQVAAARAIATSVDWPCEVLTDLATANLGCKRRVSSGLDWVFSRVEQAIVLEDDCVPDPSFFPFCEEMLARYRDDRRVGMVCGANFQFGRTRTPQSYYFSKYSIIWGWAGWRDRWRSYDVDIRQWPAVRDAAGLEDLVHGAVEAEYWHKIFERVFRGEIDTWDYQWFFANWLERRLSIVPAVNLISNVGYGANATHTRNRRTALADMRREALPFPLVHPGVPVRGIAQDRVTYAEYFRNASKRRWRRKLRRLLRIGRRSDERGPPVVPPVAVR